MTVLDTIISASLLSYWDFFLAINLVMHCEQQKHKTKQKEKPCI